MAVLKKHLHEVTICPVVRRRGDESIEDGEEELVEDLNALVVVVARLDLMQKLADSLINIGLLAIELAL